MTLKLLRKVLILVMLFSIATGCGGGGKDGESTEVIIPTIPATNPTPVGTTVDMSTFKNIFLGGASATPTSSYMFSFLSGADSLGRAWTGSHLISSYGTVIFENQSVTRSDVVTSFDLGATPTPPPYSLDISTGYFYLGTGLFYKANSSFISTPLVQGTFPTTPKVGESGNLGTVQNTNATSAVITWALNPGVNGASKFEIKYVSLSDGDGSTVGTMTYTYDLDETGNPTMVTIHSVSNSLDITIAGNKD